MASTTPDVLYPFLEPPYRMTMGLLPLDPAEWILLDDRFEEEILTKESLLADRHSDVFAALPAAAAGSREVLARLADHLPRRFPDAYRHEGAMLKRPDGRALRLDDDGLHPLDLAGRLVQEDLCLMQATGDTWTLVGASLCFPTRWKLGEKIGRPLAEIHQPVPGFAPTLGQPVERFFNRLAPGKGVWRANWGLIDDPALFQPAGHFRGAVNPAITSANAGETVWLRVERQTLLRLPGSGDILFTIRILQETLGRTAASPRRASRLAQLIGSMPEDLKRYKSIPPFEKAVQDYLRRAAGS